MRPGRLGLHGLAAAVLALAAAASMAASAASSAPGAAAVAAPAAGAPAEIVALVGATIHPVSGTEIPDGVIVVDGGRIAAVGRAGQVAVPAAARVIRLDGKHVYPGFIDSASEIGLREIQSVRGSTDAQEIGDDNANIRAQIAFNADSILIGPAVAGGVLYAHVVPGGEVVSGSSAVMRLHGWNWTDMTLRAPVGMHINYPRQTPVRNFFLNQSDEEFQKQKERAVKALQDIFDGARSYRTARDAMRAGKAPAVEVDPRYEALVPVLDGRQPLYIHATEKAQIESALDWAKREKLTRLVLVSGSDAQYVAERLAREKIPVILGGALGLPARRWEPYDAVYAAAAALDKAGVKLAIGEGSDPSQARNLPFNAAMASAFGLPKAVALRAVTLTAAEILGVADRIGSLEPGKEASFFVCDGDPLEIVTHIERVWIAGEEIDLAHERQRELYERYRNRPAPAGQTGAPAAPPRTAPAALRPPAPAP